jgi:hypothetical protein
MVAMAIAYATRGAAGKPEISPFNPMERDSDLRIENANKHGVHRTPSPTQSIS